jgi:acetolactate synthase-1/2/3 large subunit
MKPTLDAIVPQQSEEIAGAEILMRSLVEHGVDVVFGYPGGAIMPVYDALYHYQDRIRHVLVRHEQGATHAAEGYARVTGRCGVAIATSGPGATNLVTGIADALMDSTPLVCITGQVGRALLGTDAFQETDIIGVTVPITKWNYQVTSADEIAPVMAKAFAIALAGRPGPVVVDITKNAQLEKAVYRRANYTPPQRSFHAVPVAEDYDRAAQYISEATDDASRTRGPCRSSSARASPFRRENGNTRCANPSGALSVPHASPPLCGDARYAWKLRT